MLFFLFKKNYIFWFFLFNKKFIISHKKSRKKNNLNSKNKLLSVKSQKNKHHPSLSFLVFFTNDFFYPLYQSLRLNLICW